jgi:hypothetical protein
MAYTLLQLVDQVAGEMGLSQPTTVIGNAQNQVLQFLALAQRLGKDLVREYEWQWLVKRRTFTTTTAYTKTGAVITAASASVTGLSDTNNIQVGDIVSGTGIRANSEILSIDSASAITLDQPASTSGTGITLTFARQDYVISTLGLSRLIAGAMWDRTNNWPPHGSGTSQQWQSMLGSIGATGERIRFQLYNNRLRVFPAPLTATILSYDYVSSYWVVASGADTGSKETFTLDTDTCVFPDDLMAAGLKYYFLKAKKLDFEVEFAEFQEKKAICMAQDVPQQVRSYTGPRAFSELSEPSVPNGDWDLD